MRKILITLPCIALTACMGQSPTQTETPASQAAPFVVPMDPGAIPCSALSNPNALTAATEWATGQARARILSGASTQPPSTSAISTDLASYCRANGTDVVRNAARAIGA